MTDSKKLFRPKYCLVPLAARTNPNIPAKAQIYLGELNILTNEYGYCWASDEQLAEMQGVSLRTIEGWHKILEDEGFIKRDTYRKHEVNDETKKLEIRTERKIYVIDTPSNNLSEPQKTAVPCDPQKIAGRCDPQKSAGITIEPLTKEQTTTEPVVVVVPSNSPLKELDLSMETMERLYEKHPEKIHKLVERVKRWEGRESDRRAVNVILERWDSWDDNPTKNEVMDANREALSVLRKYEDQTGISDHCDVRIAVLSSHVEFVCGSVVDIVKLDEKDFKEKINALFAKYKINKK